MELSTDGKMRGHAHGDQDMTGSPRATGIAGASGETLNTSPPSELRTFLFADIRGYTRFTQERGDQAAADLVTKFASLMRDGVRQRGGEVLELRGDEVLAVFGSARQALRAAIELQARFLRESETDPALPLAVGMGIDAGEAVPVEDGYRGEALNLAARLCHLASAGEVLVTEGVVYLGRRVPGVTYAERGLVPIKGFADPIHVIAVLRTGGSPADRRTVTQSENDTTESEQSNGPLPIGVYLGALPSGTLVGRDGEWKRIMSALETVMKGTGQLVLLSGEPGIGKTRLAQEVTLKARHWKFLIATGRCYEPERTVPFYPFVEGLATLYNLSPPSIRAEAPRRWPHLGRLLPEQVGIIPPAMASPEDQHLLFRAVTGFIEALAETAPVALLFDDLQWADDSSMSLFQYLARYTRAYPVLLLGTYRDVDIHRQHPLDAVLLDLAREGLVEEVEVRRLDHEGTAALMAEIMGDKEDLSALTDLVYRRTDGNAFFIGEMLRAMVERGDLFRENGRWTIRTIHDMHVPKSIRSVIGQRLSRLETQAQEILRGASVLGQEFGFDDLVSLVTLALGRSTPGTGEAREPGTMEDEVEAALEGAMAAGLVRETGVESYAFNHALTQQAVYAELSTRRRKRLHLTAGRALERLPRAELERRAGELAWHFLEGDDPRGALRFAMLAGDTAEKVFANREAEQQYRTALELAREMEDRPRQIEALEKLGGILVIGAQYDASLHMFEEAAQLNRAEGNREGEACVLAQLGHVHYLRDTPDEGIARLKPLVEQMESEVHGPSYGLAALWAALARLYIDSCQYEEQLQAADRAVELARTVQDHPNGARLLLGAEVTRSDALWGLGQTDEALHVLEELIPRAEEAGDLTNLARALGNAGEYYFRRGEVEKDRQYLERMLKVSERRGDRYQIVLSAMSLSTNAFIQGDWARARTYLAKAQDTIRSLGPTRLSIWPTAAHAWIAFRTGDLQQAQADGQEVLSVAAQVGEVDWKRLAARLLAEIDLLKGNPGQALDRLTTQMESSGWQSDTGFLRTLARTRLELGDTAEAQALMTRAIERARRRQNRPDLVETLVLLGMVTNRQGLWDRAEQIVQEALSLARSIPFPLGEALALAELSATARGQGAAAQSDTRAKGALEIFRQLGVERDAAQVERALADEGGSATGA